MSFREGNCCIIFGVDGHFLQIKVLSFSRWGDRCLILVFFFQDFQQVILEVKEQKIQ